MSRRPRPRMPRFYDMGWNNHISNYVVAEGDILGRYLILRRCCGQRMRKLTQWKKDSYGFWFRDRIRYYCEKCHNLTWQASYDY